MKNIIKLLTVLFVFSIFANPVCSYSAESDQMINDSGLVLYYKGQYPQALQEFLKAAEVNPKNPEIFYNIGRTYYKLRSPKEAMSALQKAVELKPNYSVAKTILKKVEAELGQKDKSSVQTFSRNYKIQIPPEISYPYPDFTEGFYAYYSGDQAGSLEKFERDLKKPEKTVQVTMDQAIIYYHLRYFDDAIKYFQKAIETDPKNAAAYFNLGLSYEQTGRQDNAIESYQKAVRLNSKLAEASERLFMVKDNLLMNQINEANSYFKKADWSKAIESYEKARDMALPHSQDYSQIESNLKVAKIELDKIKNRKTEINEGYLNRNVEFGEANANPKRFVGSIVTWKGRIEAIEKHGDTTDFIMCQSSGLTSNTSRNMITNTRDNASNLTGRDNPLYRPDYAFIIRFEKPLPQSSLINELSDVTVVGKIAGIEKLKNALKYSDYTDKIVIRPLKVNIVRQKKGDELKDLGQRYGANNTGQSYIDDQRNVDQRDIDTYDAGELVLEFNN